MKQLNRVFNYVKHASTSKVLVSSVFILALATFVGVSIKSASAADIRDCSANSIMKCGALTKGDFLNKYKANEPKDLPAIYSAYGLQPNELDRFWSTAKMGTAYKDGRIVVDGQVVATDTMSIGRDRKTYSSPVNIGSKTYHASRSTDVFGSDSIPVMVMFDANGVMEFATLTACGNPINGKKVTPKYSCDMLNMTAVSGKKNTYNFSTKATATNAKIAKVVYEFGDGTKVEKTNPAEVVQHTYSKPGNYTAKVTVHVTVNGQTKTVTGAQCTKPVKVEEEQKPAYKCDELILTTIRKETREYRFTVKASASGGATLKDANFDFDDGQSAAGIKPNTPTTVTVTHKYAEAKDYTIVATVNFNVAGGVKSDTCEVKLSPEKTPPSECPEKPGSGLPVGHPDCQTKPEDCTTNPNLENCKTTPEVLPSTGPTEMVAGALGLGSVAGAGYYYLGSRRNLLETLLNR